MVPDLKAFKNIKVADTDKAGGDVPDELTVNPKGMPEGYYFVAFAGDRTSKIQEKSTYLINLYTLKCEKDGVLKEGTKPNIYVVSGGKFACTVCETNKINTKDAINEMKKYIYFIKVTVTEPTPQEKYRAEMENKQVYAKKTFELIEKFDAPTK